MSSRKPDYVLREVVAVREDEGQPPAILPLQFELRVRCSPERLLLFRLAISLAGSAFDKTAETNIYLHITADFLDSLDHMVRDKSDTNARNPPYLDSVRRQLKDTNSIARLRFQLLRGKHIQLAVPKDFTIDQLCDDVSRSTFENAESLAAASTFSLYLPHNILSSDSVPKYKDAIERSRSLTDALRQGLVSVMR
ncbi:ankyrin [Colletotrichum sp. SAR 10_86]|nr:ankyrin [Colletotrichum sp. SAR 10_86]